jgi:signal transduction histidine kinase
VQTELLRLRATGKWFAVLRVASVPLAVGMVVATTSFPSGYRFWAWATCGLLALGTAVLFALTWWIDFDLRGRRRVSEAAVLFDTAIVFGFMFLYAYRNGQPTWALFYLPIIEAGLRFGMAGGVGVALAAAPVLVAAEFWRSRHFMPHSFRDDSVALRAALGVIVGAVVGQLTSMLMRQTDVAETRAGEAERFRDELGRRADVLEAANRCARALGSSLELDQAFAAFIRELRGLLQFDRIAIVLAEEGQARVMAVAGIAADTVLPAGTARPVGPSLLGDLIEASETIYREDMSDARYPEEEEFLALGLLCRVAAPLLLGARTIGMLSLVRREARSFDSAERELAGLLGRLVASAVQNIRAYETERRTVEELRRLSALRADFVSLVSHELRTPMAAVIGSARTLQQRWRELSPGQRESFLSLIGDETSRLAALIADVLDTSRIEAGTFTYSFSDVDVGELVRESAAAGNIGQDEVEVRVETREPLPIVRGDRERLRQVLANLIDNAIKYSPTGDVVDVHAYAENSEIRIDVRDRGPGIAKENQKLIFEKFGRVNAGGVGKPGTGLGLFIARSIAEAHGGSIEVRSAPDQGALFTLALPAEVP